MNVPRITNKRDARYSLVYFLQHCLDRFLPWSYQLYADQRLDAGWAPLTRGEFTWWMHYYDRMLVIDPTGTYKIQVFRDWDWGKQGNITTYYWERRHGEEEETA